MMQIVYILITQLYCYNNYIMLLFIIYQLIYTLNVLMIHVKSFLYIFFAFLSLINILNIFKLFFII